MLIDSLELIQETEDARFEKDYMARREEFASPDRHNYDLPLSSSGRC
jgi:hypothetical protein